MEEGREDEQSIREKEDDNRKSGWLRRWKGGWGGVPTDVCVATVKHFVLLL